MTYGWVSRHAACCLGAVLLLSHFTITPAGAQTSVRAARAAATPSKNVHQGTFKSADDLAVHVTLSGGAALDAELRPSSVFLRNGLAAGAADFAPGSPVTLRTRTRASDGAASLVLLCDPATAAAIDAYRRKPLVGHVVSQDDKSLVVQPDGRGVLPLTLHVTAKTVCRVSNGICDWAAERDGRRVE